MVIPMTAKDGAPAQNFTLSFAGSMQQNVGSDSVSKVAQDGYAAGEYTNFQINNDGTVVGIYSNQQTRCWARSSWPTSPTRKGWRRRAITCGRKPVRPASRALVCRAAAAR